MYCIDLSIKQCSLYRDIEKEAEQNWRAKQAARPKIPGQPYDILHYFARHDEVRNFSQGTI